LTSRLKLAFYDFLQVPGAVGRCGTKIAINLMNKAVYFVNKCRLLVLLASLTRQYILAYFPTGNSLLNFSFSGMPVIDGSFGWRWLSTESAGIGEKRLWLTGLWQAPSLNEVVRETKHYLGVECGERQNE